MSFSKGSWQIKEEYLWAIYIACLNIDANNWSCPALLPQMVSRKWDPKEVITTSKQIGSSLEITKESVGTANIQHLTYWQTMMTTNGNQRQQWRTIPSVVVWQQWRVVPVHSMWTMWKVDRVPLQPTPVFGRGYTWRRVCIHHHRRTREVRPNWGWGTIKLWRNILDNWSLNDSRQ